MIRFCPNCKTERALQEMFCEGLIQEQPCGWDLAGEPIRAAGWRPQAVFTEETLPPVSPAQGNVPDLLCENGHPMVDGDLMCLECGSSLAQVTSYDAQPDSSEPEGIAQTLIDGWRLIRQISSTDGVRERYLAKHEETAQQAVLTLYRPGAEPDPAIYDVIRRLPCEHVPEIIATGRWDDRAYEVIEELTGGSLAELGSVIRDSDSVQHVVNELGLALHAFNEAGLRHRDLRPASLLVRSREPLDLVISGFGSARLSEFDLDIVSPLETSRYMAPEAIAGGVAPASDWWSLGMILLEQLTQGACFDGINANAFLIHVLANGVPIPDDLDPRLHLLLRGLLARDRHQRWQWPQVEGWLNGITVEAPASSVQQTDEGEGATLLLGERRFHKPGVFALAAAQADNWQQALDHLLRGVIVTWAEQVSLAPSLVAGLRQVVQHEGIEDDFRLMLALRILNPEIPLIHRGDIVTPGWLLAVASQIPRRKRTSACPAPTHRVGRRATADIPAIDLAGQAVHAMARAPTPVSRHRPSGTELSVGAPGDRRRRPDRAAQRGDQSVPFGGLNRRGRRRAGQGCRCRLVRLRSGNPTAAAFAT